ncbi:unnamed protein product [Nezara viridula]|uniref:Uncharacterized protein n=1 Tax=Nezara viridula TaxID=85310 RepID=A0A9P0MS22_NEZVI|nr:unnamed protein product [Nezara viridula]
MEWNLTIPRLTQCNDQKNVLSQEVVSAVMDRLFPPPETSWIRDIPAAHNNRRGYDDLPTISNFNISSA